MKENKNISIILAPFGIGGPNDAAKDGPSALLRFGVLEDLKEIGFNVKKISPPKTLITISKQETIKKNRIKNVDAILQINEWLSHTVQSSIKEGYIPLTIGGDHSLAIGTISGITSILNNTGVLWIDRHFDAHSPKNTPSWRAHGMPVSIAISKENYDPHPDFQELLHLSKNKRLPKVKPENFVQIGIGEGSRVKPPTKWYSMEDLDNMGINKIIDLALNHLLKRVKNIYVAWDIDSMNVTGTGTSGDGQLTLREGLQIARAINKKIRLQGRLAGFETMEIAPSLERKNLKGQTADWATQLINASFGVNLFNNPSRMTRNINMHALK